MQVLYPRSRFDASGQLALRRRISIAGPIATEAFHMELISQRTSRNESDLQSPERDQEETRHLDLRTPLIRILSSCHIHLQTGRYH